MAKLMILILVVTVLTIVHTESSHLDRFLPQGQTVEDRKLESSLPDTYGDSADDNSNSVERDFATSRQEEDEDGNIGAERLNRAAYDVRYPGRDTSGGAANTIDSSNGAPSSRQLLISRNLARLLYSMPQFSNYYKRSYADGRISEMQRFRADMDHTGSYPQTYHPPWSRATERQVQLLRDQLNKGNPRREKRRRCQFDPSLGIKNPSSCDTDSYFQAHDYTSRNLWDSAGRR